jgi:WD40 repeat protein
LQGSQEAIVALGFTPDSQTLLSSNEQDLLTLWDVESGERKKTLPGIGESYWLGSVALSADGSWLAATSRDQTITIWDVSKGERVYTFPVRASQPRSVAWSADGRRLACGTDDGSILLWDRRSGMSLQTLRSERPYERMNIRGVSGITEAQRASLKTLGAIEKEVRRE